MSWSTSDEHYMKLALRLAARGAGWVSPNPMVGAVVVQHAEVGFHGQVVSRGYHRRYGEPHAEVEALSRAGEKARGATLYVTLEPCNHHGLTPPCTEAIVAAGLERVVIASPDPNPRVAGGGARFLSEHGLKVEMGLLEDQARRLNEAWFKWVATGLPFVVAKAACSLDGRIATAAGESQWLTGEAARAFGHRLRHQCDAILVGVGTVLADDPQLTVRLGGRKKLVGGGGQGSQTPAPSAEPPPPTPYVGGTGLQPVPGSAEHSHLAVPPSFPSGPEACSREEALGAQASRQCSTGNRKPKTENPSKDPIRVVLDSQLRIPPTARLLHLASPAPSLIATTDRAPADKVKALQQLGAEVLMLPAEENRVALGPLLELLGKRRVTSLLVEGGAETLGAFFDARLVDKFYFFYAPKILGGPPAYPAVAGKGVRRLAEAHRARDLTVRRLGPDILLTGRLR